MTSNITINNADCMVEKEGLTYKEYINICTGEYHKIKNTKLESIIVILAIVIFFSILVISLIRIFRRD